MGAADLLRRIGRLVPLENQVVLLAHVIDAGPRGELQLGRERVPRRPLPPHRARAVGEAEQAAARAMLDEAAEVARGLGLRTYTLVAEGEPGRVLCALRLNSAARRSRWPRAPAGRCVRDRTRSATRRASCSTTRPVPSSSYVADAGRL